MACQHLDQIKVPEDHKLYKKGCQECVKNGTTWVHLRECRTCGHVGCCNSSEHKHAQAHFNKTKHPIITSIEPGEHWSWCYVDNDEVTVPYAKKD